MNARTPIKTLTSLSVFRASDFPVVDGVNQGDSLGYSSELALGDIYALTAATNSVQIEIEMNARTCALDVSAFSSVGRAGAHVVVDARITLMSQTGKTVEALVLVELNGEMVQEVFLCPLSELETGTQYTLIALGDARPADVFSQPDALVDPAPVALTQALPEAAVLVPYGAKHVGLRDMLTAKRTIETTFH